MFWKQFSGNIKTKSNDIFNLVIQLVEKYQAVDPFSIAQCANIEVDYVAFAKRPLGEIVYLKGKPIILINDQIQNDVQSYFTCAHELGHLTVQPYLRGYHSGIYSQNKYERQADEFALDLIQLLYIDDNGHPAYCYDDLVHQYGSPVDKID